MREDRLDHLLGIALLAEDRGAVLGMLVERRVDLVVEVVQQRDDAPELLVLAEPARVRPRRGLDGERVPEQRLALGVRRERLPRLSLALRPSAVYDTPPHEHDYALHRNAGLRDRGRSPAQRHRPRRREQERRAADPGGHRARVGAGAADERAADPRRADDGRAARRHRRRRGVAGRERDPDRPGRRPQVRARRGALPSDPRLVPARGAAAGAARQRDRAAARRRRDRTPPARPAHPRPRRARRRDRHQRPLRDARAAAPRHVDLPRRGERDGDRERRHGGRARRGRDRDRERRLRAARPGSLPLPRLARRPDRGDRVERAPHPRRHRAARRRLARRARAHRGRQLHRPRRGDRRRHHDRGTSSRRISSRSCPRSRGSECTSRWGRRRCAFRPASGS